MFVRIDDGLARSGYLPSRCSFSFGTPRVKGDGSPPDSALFVGSASCGSRSFDYFVMFATKFGERSKKWADPANARSVE